MRMMLFALAALFAAILLPATDALAWGPGVHLAVGDYLLKNLDLLPSMAAQILAADPRAFLYGALSPDIFLGKGSRVKPAHSHNWATARAVHDQADTVHLAAHSLGYLTHLAADVVAHNYYVPNLLAAMPVGGRLPHVYLEMQADAWVDWNASFARGLLACDAEPADWSMVRATGKNRSLFLLRKHLFCRSFRLWESSLSERSLRLADRRLPLLGNRELLHSMFDLALDLATHVLQDPDDSPAYDFDPIGSRNLRRAGKLARSLRRAWRRDAELAFPVAPRLLDLHESMRDADRERPQPLPAREAVRQ
ncbi:MAG: zinc dependent phospholipase C family protein [Thermodesulfobacteriota bacterium]